MSLKNFIMIAFFVIIGIINAQPSKSEMTKKIDAEYENINIELLGNGGIDQEWENGIYVENFYQPFRIKQTTEYKGVNLLYKASLKYQKSSSGWFFKQFTVGSTTYEGLETPDKNETIALLKANYEKWLQPTYDEIVGDLSEITFPEDPEWYWHKVNYISFKVKITYSAIVSYTEVEKSENVFKISLKRPDINGKWGDVFGYIEPDRKKSLGKTKYTEAQIKKMETLDELDAKATMNALPQVDDAPNFASDEQLFYYIHNKILTSPNESIESHILKVIDKSCYEAGSDVYFQAYHANWINYLVEHANAYKSMFCEYPGVKAHQTGQIEFLDREFRSYATITAIQRGNTWKLLDYKFFPADEESLERMKLNNTNCQQKPDLGATIQESFKVGDAVKVAFSNGTRDCTIDKLDPDNSNRYFVKIVGDNSGKGYWVDGSFITKADSNSSTNDIKSKTKDGLNKLKNLFK